MLEEKEEKAFGEYRTRQLVLEAWDRPEAEPGPVVVRNYREEMEVGSSEVGSSKSGAPLTASAAVRPARKVAEPKLTYQAADQLALLDDTPAALLPTSLLPRPATAANASAAAHPGPAAHAGSDRRAGRRPGR